MTCLIPNARLFYFIMLMVIEIILFPVGLVFAFFSISKEHWVCKKSDLIISFLGRHAALCRILSQLDTIVVCT